MPPYATNLEHLRDEFRRLDWLLEMAIQQFRLRRHQDVPAEFQGLHISDQEIDGLIGDRHKQPDQPWRETQAKAMELHREIQQRIAESQAASIVLRLPYLQQTFQLNQFETDLLLLALAPELDLRYQKLYAYLHDDVTRKRPSIDLALGLFCCSWEEQIKARETFMQGSSLLDNNLLLLQEDPIDRPSPLLSHSFKLDERIAEFLLGSDRLDSRLYYPFPLLRQVIPQRPLHSLVLPEAVRAMLEKIISLESPHSPCLCLLYGASGTGKKACAESIARAKQQSLLVLDLPAMLKADLPFTTLLGTAFREARIYNSILYLDGWQELLTDEPKSQIARRLVAAAIQRISGLVFLGSLSAWQPQKEWSYPMISIELPLPDERSRRQLWQAYLNGKQTSHSDLNVDYLASAFRFSGGQIQRVITHAESQVSWSEAQGTLTSEALLRECRLESSQQLITFARKITPKRDWQDLVLPKDTLAQLRELCRQVRYRAKVYTDWGFEDRLSLGKGLIALFTGNSGTGKTLSAEILAKELGLDLYKVDLSLVVSKYIGETEKNLSQVFTQAQASNAILFFDEADALFGKRSEIKDAHDRYANLEINYLLQRVEEYEGIIILASNLSNNIDEAFVRRLNFSIEFPFPNERDRLRIWRGIFPDLTPLAEEIDFEFLACKFKIAGGHIKNVALAAAFQAAEEGTVIQMEHLMLAMKREYQKLGKVCERSDFEQYYDLVH